MGLEKQIPRGESRGIYTGVPANEIEFLLSVSGKRNRRRSGEALLPQRSQGKSLGCDQNVS
jgi:hypothetical protein